MASTDVGTLVEAAAAGDRSAWSSLVRRFAGLLWAVCRAYGLSAADAADVAQTCWLRLVEHLGRIQDPDRVGAWLATTARRECQALVRRRGRQVPAGTGDGLDVADPTPVALDAGLLADERARQLAAALGSLPARCQQLLRILMADPPPSYEDVSAALDMPVGSIGPTRGRCLKQLRAKLAGISDDSGASGHQERV